MKNRRWNFVAFLTTGLAAVVVTVGCNPTENTVLDAKPSPSGTSTSDTEAASTKVGDATTAMTDSEHGHNAGSHGGIMVSLGRDSYHVEAVVDAEGAIRLYTLGKDETRVIDVENQTLKGFVKADGDDDSQSVTFEPSPQEGDAENMTSLFVGKLPEKLIGRKLDVTIPNIRIAGERFRLGFQSGQESHGESDGMPGKVADDEEKELYMTPGGRYTLADIAANGNSTASEKFKGIKSDHNMKPTLGDKLCPISGTKANSKFTWIIDSKPYEFCCPPCVDEFLTAAKSSTDPLPDPESFLKK